MNVHLSEHHRIGVADPPWSGSGEAQTRRGSPIEP
jgi:hypothetical protein